MRADRLLAMLMLLQARGRLTARTLAEELEVSERTVYRDVDALSVAGVPVYTERGPGGGIALLDSYRTTLTGLSGDELRALFMLSIPAPLAELGVSGELKGALRKLSAALPAARRVDEHRVRQRIHVDSVPWFHETEPVPHLQALHRAVWEDRRVFMDRRLQFETTVERLIEPYALVAKAGLWHLVCAADGHVRVHRMTEVVGVRLTGERFERPADFDLAGFWETWCAAFEADRPHYPVVTRVAPQLVPFLPAVFGEGIRAAIADAGPPDPEGWITLPLGFETLEGARSQVLRLGGAIEVLEPRALRDSVADYGRQIAARYDE